MRRPEVYSKTKSILGLPMARNEGKRPEEDHSVSWSTLKEKGTDSKLFRTIQTSSTAFREKPPPQNQENGRFLN